MTQEEQVASLHARMEARIQLRNRRKTGILSAAGAVLTACLLLVIFSEGAAHVGGTAGMYSGATMLFEGAGAYVLVALLAFMTGVVVTLLCLHQQKKAGRHRKVEQREKETEETEETA